MGMKIGDPVKEGIRLLTFCNACRYCEALCSVWKAIEVRKFFNEADAHYLGNLCFDCRACYYACQFVPPHVYELDPPETFDSIRLETYRNFSSSARMFDFLSRPLGAFLITMISIVLLSVYALVNLGESIYIIFKSFYDIMPRSVIIGGGLILVLYNIGLMASGGAKFWKMIHGRFKDLLVPKYHLKAIARMLAHTNLTGGGIGCNYPQEEEPGSYLRLIEHMFIFYGFILLILSTLLAFIYEDFLNIQSPFPLTSPAVTLGVVGGSVTSLGILMALALKLKSRRLRFFWLDVTFEILLLLVIVSGFAVLLLRGTWLLGSLFTVHLGFVLAFFILAPFSKPLHIIYRYLSALKYEIENAKYKLE